MNNPFEYHKPNGDEIERIENVRQAFFACFQQVVEQTHLGSISGRYRALALTQLEEAAMWATKSIVFERENEWQAEFPKREPANG